MPKGLSRAYGNGRVEGLVWCDRRKRGKRWIKPQAHSLKHAWKAYCIEIYIVCALEYPTPKALMKPMKKNLQKHLERT